MFSCFLVSSNCISMTFINYASVCVRFHNSKRYIKLLSVEIWSAGGEAKGAGSGTSKKTLSELEIVYSRSPSTSLHNFTSPQSLAGPFLRQVKHSSREEASTTLLHTSPLDSCGNQPQPRRATTDKTEAHVPRWLLSGVLKSSDPYRDFPLR